MASWAEEPHPDDTPPPGHGEPYDNRTIDNRCHCGRPLPCWLHDEEEEQDG